MAILVAMPACSHHKTDQLLVASPADNPQAMKHIRVVLNVKESGTQVLNASVAEMPARSYAVDPHGYRIVGRDRSGKSLGSLWVADPLFVRVFDESGSAWHEHAIRVPSAQLTVFVPFLADLAALSVGYPHEAQTQVGLTALIREYCGPRASRDEDCQDWEQVNPR